HRAIGGHPGPCYSHPGALADRQRFVAAAVEHFRGHPALQMWDVWNEPELCFPQRVPDLATMVCYCPHCAAGCRQWLAAKYAGLDRLNAVWGRCYERWDQVELPRDTGTLTDFIDFREFHLDTMAGEAAWRLDTVRRLDPGHGRYLHVVPNCHFSAVTCADDFAMAEPCEVFASTMTGGPTACLHTLSAARGRVCYNVESHLNHGSTDLHQKVNDLDDLRRDLLPQLGLGIKGVLFWQYRAETLGIEAPAWGLVRTDGSPRPVTEAARRFWAVLQPHAPALRRAFPAAAQVGIWRGRRNEIFHFCLRHETRTYNAGLDAWIQALHWANHPARLVSDAMLAADGLAPFRLLVVPFGYYLSHEEASALDGWVRAGGVLVSEAHLGAYDATTGRHSRQVPGCGLAESWGLQESESTSPWHLRLASTHDFGAAAVSDDVRQAVAQFGVSGGDHFPLRLADGSLAWGAHRYAELAGEGLELLATFDGRSPCMARKSVGRGAVFCCGTSLGQAAAERSDAGLRFVLARALAAAGLAATGGCRPEIPDSVHLDLLLEDGRVRFAGLTSRADRPQRLHLRGQGRWQGLYSGRTWDLDGDTQVQVPAGLVDLFVVTGER
ncbi:MAG: beta-galactosidase, partial [Gemmatimonadota bacterium]